MQAIYGIGLWVIDMMNIYDIDFMKNSVMECIGEWKTSMYCIRPLPVDQQPNWNALMNEYSGDVVNKKFTIPMERKDTTNYYEDSTDGKNGTYGMRDDSHVMYSVPTLIPQRDIDDNIVVDANGNNIMEQFEPDINDTYEIDGEIYYVRTIKERIGEHLLILYRFVG